MDTPLLSSTCDILIIGAGPVGMTLASELARHGVRCRIIDKSLHTAQTTKALGVQARTLELLEKMGLAEAMLAQGIQAHSFAVYSERKRLARIDFTHFVDSPYPYLLMIPQNATETILNEHLLRQEVTIERGVELMSFTQGADGVEAVLRRTTGEEERVAARWLIGCDGAHSTVRHLLGLEFRGSTFLESFVLADMSLGGALPDDEGRAYLHAGDAVAFFPMLGGQHRIFIAYRPPTNPEGEVTLEEVQQMIDVCGPSGIRAHNPTWWSRFHINQRKVQHYRKEQTFLLGDAAHIHSPVAAQGMNTGIQDAFNLAWKLALVLEGDAPEALLDSYEAEREPVGAALLRGTMLLSRMVWSHNPLVTTLRDRLIPLASPTKAMQRRLTAAISEIGIAYRHSPLVHAQNAEHGMLRAGDRAPDAPIQREEDTAPGRLFALLHDTHHVLLIFSDGQPVSELPMQQLRAWLARDYNHIVVTYQVEPETNAMKAGGVSDPGGALRRRYGITKTGLVLIRPDGYIGFRASSLEATSLQTYLAQHFFPGKVVSPVQH